MEDDKSEAPEMVAWIDARFCMGAQACRDESVADILGHTAKGFVYLKDIGGKAVAAGQDNAIPVPADRLDDLVAAAGECPNSHFYRRDRNGVTIHDRPIHIQPKGSRFPEIQPDQA